jgi:threonine aldolase
VGPVTELVFVTPAPGVRRSVWVGGATGRRPHVQLNRLLRAVPEDTPAFGAGNLVTRLEETAATLLGKPAAVLLPTGKMAQQIALRVHADRAGLPVFAGHPSCHLVHWEYDGYSVVHGLRFHELGRPDRLFDESDLRALPEPVAAVVWELPQRDLGGTLPTFATLTEQVRLARDELGTVPHLDGARLWEAQTAYRRPLAEIAGLFDSVYVSLYKTLQAPRGALLLGDEDFVGEARTWSVRLGGESAGNWPMAAAGLVAFEDILPRMDAYREHAVAVAAELNRTGVVTTNPTVPLTPLFHLTLPVAPEAAAQAHLEISTETGIEIFRSVRRLSDPQRCAVEISIGESAIAISPIEITRFLTALVDRATATKPSVH